MAGYAAPYPFRSLPPIRDSGFALDERAAHLRDESRSVRVRVPVLGGRRMGREERRVGIYHGNFPLVPRVASG